MPTHPLETPADSPSGKPTASQSGAACRKICPVIKRSQTQMAVPDFNAMFSRKRARTRARKRARSVPEKCPINSATKVVEKQRKYVLGTFTGHTRFFLGRTLDTVPGHTYSGTFLGRIDAVLQFTGHTSGLQKPRSDTTLPTHPHENPMGILLGDLQHCPHTHTKL